MEPFLYYIFFNTLIFKYFMIFLSKKILYDFILLNINVDFSIGRSGRAGRSGEAITFYTEEDIPFLRNVSNLMASSGCEVPSWLTELQLQKKKWKKHRPDRDSISTKPDPPKSDSISTKLKLQKKLKKHRPKKDSILTKPDLPKSDLISTKPKLQKKKLK